MQTDLASLRKKYEDAYVYVCKRNLEIEDYDSKTHATERAANETVIELLKQKIRDIAKEQVLDYKLVSETYDFEPDTFTASGAVDTADFITFKAFKNNGEEEQKTVFHALFGGAEVTWKYKDGMYQVDSVDKEIVTPSANVRIIDSDGRGRICPYCGSDNIIVEFEALLCLNCDKLFG